MAPQNNIRVLDCTLRDGGYYNAWDFDKRLVEQYLLAMKESRVDFVEIGFRFLDAKKYVGPYAFTSADFVSSLSVPQELDLGIMINAGDVVRLENCGEDPFQRLICKQDEECFRLVRIACHPLEVDAALRLSVQLKRAGFLVGLNIMQINGVNPQDLRKLVNEISSNSDSIDCLYFADSLGNLTPSSAESIYGVIRSSWSGPIGFHGHDNRGLALQNTLACHELGVSWLDATVQGMGRGAGNTRLELLLIELESVANKYTAAPAIEISQEFLELKRQYSWGTSPYYYLGAVKNIHPTYIQNLQNLHESTCERTLNAIKILANEASTKYTDSKFESAQSRSYLRATPGSKGICPNSITGGRDVIILGSGPTRSTHKDGLASLVKLESYYSLAINFDNIADNDYIDAYISVNQAQIVSSFDIIQKLDKNVILPLSTIASPDMPNRFDNNIKEYNVLFEADNFQINQSGPSIIPSDLAIYYALAFAIESKAKRILLAGFDGFAPGNPKQAAMVSAISRIKHAIPENCDVYSITPTTYPLDVLSLYHPDLRRE